MKCGGLFRLSAGNPKLVERLRASFDRTGDADLEGAGDVATVASLLKLWLRELPEPVIASHVATELLCIHESKYMTVTKHKLATVLDGAPRPSNKHRGHKNRPKRETDHSLPV
jgi:hypothetical protein